MLKWLYSKDNIKFEHLKSGYVKKFLSKFWLVLLIASGIGMTNFSFGSAWNEKEHAELYDGNSSPQFEAGIDSLRILKDNFGHTLEGNVLDFGCGSGRLTDAIFKSNAISSLVGYDPAKAMIEFANGSYARPEEIQFSSISYEGKYDWIVSFSAFHLVANPRETLSKLKGSLNENGKMFLVYPILNEAFGKAMDDLLGEDSKSKVITNADRSALMAPDSAANLFGEVGLEGEFRSHQFEYIFQSREKFKNWLLAVVPQIFRLSENVDKSLEQLVASYAKITDQVDSEQIRFVNPYMLAFVSKH